MSGVGHNAQLKSVVDRIERLEAEKKVIAGDISDVYKEAKSAGLDVKALRQIVRERKQDPKAREQHEAVVDTYKLALGMLSGTVFESAARTNAGVSA